MNIIRVRDLTLERARERRAAMMATLEQQQTEAIRPSQEQLRAEFDLAAQTLEGLDLYAAKYGPEERDRQWLLRLKREGGVSNG